jgi:carbamoyl-phosphate synthase large subunit
MHENDIKCEVLHWPNSGMEPNVTDFMKGGKIDLVINIPKDLSTSELNNDYSIRRTAIDLNIPLLTNARLASAYIKAITQIEIKDLPIKHMGEYKSLD